MVSQPYVYQRHELSEPDWRRFPGWAGVSTADWESAQWQRAHCVKNARQLAQVIGREQVENRAQCIDTAPQFLHHRDVSHHAAAMSFLPDFNRKVRSG